LNPVTPPNSDAVWPGPDAGGYRFTVSSGLLDVEQFEALVRAGCHEVMKGAVDIGAQKLRAALDLWTGPPFEESERSRVLQEAAPYMTACYLNVFEAWAEAELALGNTGTVADQIAD
jgi:Bacterial transcriptional activator domain